MVPSSMDKLSQNKILSSIRRNYVCMARLRAPIDLQESVRKIFSWVSENMYYFVKISTANITYDIVFLYKLTKHAGSILSKFALKISQVTACFPSWIEKTCCLKWSLWSKLLLQMSHVISRFPSWTNETCCFKKYVSSKLTQQISHSKN